MMQAILRVAVPVPLRQTFDYLAPENCTLADLRPGSRLLVPFGRRKLTGILLATVKTSTCPPEKIRPAFELLDKTPIMPPDLLALGIRLADYYHHPVGEVLAAMLPAPLRQGKPAPDFLPEPDLPASPAADAGPSLTLNPAQQQAVSLMAPAVTTGQFHTFLLEGVTGSGKTEVYLGAISQALACQKQALVLVPEISLTPQTLARFSNRFSVMVSCFHSGMTPRARLQAWHAARSGHARIIIGTRSAIFLPLPEPGLIVIDEEHDLSFRQQDNFRYHARDIAVLRGKSAQIPVILGSATPSLETLQNVRAGRYQAVYLPERAGCALHPACKIIDLRNTKPARGLAPQLIEQIGMHLNAGNQVLVFLNRRGFAPALLCHACGWSAICEHCDRHLTWHKRANRLRCHHCNGQRHVPPVCDKCGSAALQSAGTGTEKLEEVLAALFPDFPLTRLDRDSTKRKGTMEQALASIVDGGARILIGTQMLAKGHHFPDVTLVAIVDPDGGFFSSDFRALERMGQLILQVGGRAGRATKPGTVILQTHQPDHPLLNLLLQDGYPAFASALLQERAAASLPPFSFFALFRAEAKSSTEAERFLEHIKSTGQQMHRDGTVVMQGPIPAPMPRRAGYCRAQLLLQAMNRVHLHRLLRDLLPAVEKIRTPRALRWSLDIDPMEVL